MKIDVEDLIKEKKNCCEKVQKSIEKYTKGATTEFLLRNLTQIIFYDELHPKKYLSYYKSFDYAYSHTDNINNCKTLLIKILTETNNI